MYIEFTSSRLHDASTSIGDANRLFGTIIGTEEFHQLFGHKALKLHPLRGDRDGKYAIALTGNYRLILEKIDEETVRVVEVEDNHGH